MTKDSPVDFQAWASAVLPEDRHGAETILQEARDTKTQVSAEFRITIPDGSLRYVQAAYGVILDDAGWYGKVSRFSAE